MAIDKEKFAERANERYQKARTFWRNWRAEARDDYAFVSGQQWVEEDAQELDAQGRPAITFNYSEKMIDAVVGAEVANRQETTYLPRGTEDGGAAELWNAAAGWVREQCDAEHEESDAYRDALICGIGWTWTHLSQEEDLDGEILIDRIDPLEMFPDPGAIKAGLKDRRWHDRLFWADESDVRTQWPNAIFSVEEEDATGNAVRHGRAYMDDVDGTYTEEERHVGKVQIRLHEMYEMEDVYRAMLPGEDGQPQLQELSKKDLDQVRKLMPDLEFVKQRKRVYYRAFFAGETLLEVKPSPCQVGYCMQAITVKRDRNRNTWYGLVRVMKDPQRWANKWLSQVLYIINSNAKGGVLAEVGAFVDPTRAQEEWSSPDSVTLLNEGGINKVQQKQQAPYPAGLDKLMGFALSSLPMVTGINLEALGLANREQAGVLEQQRKQAAYGLLAPVFDGQRRYRKAQGKVLLYYIDNYISDGRLVRIGGPESQKFLPLVKTPGAMKYDVVVDQSPNAPDTKQTTWETLVEIIPAMLKAGIPLPPDLLDFTPLPTSLVLKWKEFAGQQQQGDQEMQQEMQKVQQENTQLKQQAGNKQEELLLERQKAEAELEMDRQKMQVDIALEQQKAQAQYELEVFKQDKQFELENRKILHDKNMKQEQMNNDFRLETLKEGGGVDTKDFPQILEQLAKASEVIAQQAQASNATVAQAVAQLAQALGKPRQLVLDAAGMPVGSTIN